MMFISGAGRTIWASKSDTIGIGVTQSKAGNTLSRFLCDGLAVIASHRKLTAASTEAGGHRRHACVWTSFRCGNQKFIGTCSVEHLICDENPPWAMGIDMHPGDIWTQSSVAANARSTYE
jgi:hypothetical protein